MEAKVEIRPVGVRKEARMQIKSDPHVITVAHLLLCSSFCSSFLAAMLIDLKQSYFQVVTGHS